MGSLVTSTYQQGIVPLMTKEETSHYALRAVVRATTREDFEIKLGRLQYSFKISYYHKYFEYSFYSVSDPVKKEIRICSFLREYIQSAFIPGRHFTSQTAFILLKEYPPNNPNPIVKAASTPISRANE